MIPRHYIPPSLRPSPLDKRPGLCALTWVLVCAGAFLLGVLFALNF